MVGSGNPPVREHCCPVKLGIRLTRARNSPPSSPGLTRRSSKALVSFDFRRQSGWIPGAVWIAGSSPAMTAGVASNSRKMANISVISEVYHGTADLNRTAVDSIRASSSELMDLKTGLPGQARQ